MSAVEEFKELGQFHRFENGIQTGQVAVYLTASGLLINALVTKDVSDGSRKAICLIGAILTLSFWMITERAGDFLHDARRRMMDLEESVNYRIFPATPRTLLSATNSIRLIFVIAFPAWCAVAFPNEWLVHETYAPFPWPSFCGAISSFVILIFLVWKGSQLGQPKRVRNPRSNLLFRPPVIPPPLRLQRRT